MKTVERLGIAVARVAAFAGLIVAITGFEAVADPITVLSTSHFRSFNTTNSAGIQMGDRVLFSVRALPNGDNDGDGFADSNGTSPPTTVVASQDGVVLSVPFSPATVDPDAFIRTLAFDDGSGPFGVDLRDSWRFDLSNGADTAVAFSPSIQGFDVVPFVSNMSMSGGGTTPTFNWTLPDGFSPDGIWVQVWDLENIGSSGVADRVFRTAVANTATSYMLPDGILEMDHRYSVSIQLQERRAGGAGSIASQSRSFFDFVSSPVSDPVFLPIVDPTGSPSGGPVFTFDFDVTARDPVYIDPDVAVGYDYETRDGNPNFASVVLPNVGDGLFELWLFDETDSAFDTGITLIAGAPFDFTTDLTDFGIGAEGLSKFRILGIEASAGLDPADALAFLTCLTFVEDGRFTGTMTPISMEVEVPEPNVSGLFLTSIIGLAGLGMARRRKSA